MPMEKLTFLLIIYALSVKSQMIVNNNTCQNPNGADCYGVRLSSTGIGSSYGLPLYTVSLVPAIPEYYDIDNLCLTYLSIGGNSYMLIRSTVYKNGSYSIGKYIESPINVAAYRAKGKDDNSGCSTCVFNDYIIATLEGACSGTYAYYRCHLFGACVGPVSNIYGGIVAHTPPEDLSSECYKGAIAEFNSQGQIFTDACGVQLPNRMARRCVTSIGGVPTIGADAVKCRDRLEL